MKPQSWIAIVAAFVLGVAAIVAVITHQPSGAPTEPIAAQSPASVEEPIAPPGTPDRAADPQVPGSTAAAPDGAVEPLETPIGIQYRIEAKLHREPLSEIQHDLLGAWDNAPGSSQPGSHRTYVLVVDPKLSDQQILDLLRDVDQRNRDADTLDVRIYDDRAAATRTGSADGSLGLAGMVGQATRNRALEVDSKRIRGRLVE